MLMNGEGTGSAKGQKVKEGPRREFLAEYAKGKKLFQVVVHISDAPGSLSAVLDILSRRVNLYGTHSYTLKDGTAMFSAFAEALTDAETPDKLRSALQGTKATLEAEAREGKDGLLIDTFHKGLVMAGADYMLLRRDGLDGVFDRIVRLLGTGGEVLLYEEGKAMGKHNAMEEMSELGSDVVLAHVGYLAKQLTAEGWGDTESDTHPGSKEIVITVHDCLECAHRGDVRRKCDFLRGYFEGTAEVTRGGPVRAEEIECRLTGGKACVFKLSME